MNENNIMDSVQKIQEKERFFRHTGLSCQQGFSLIADCEPFFDELKINAGALYFEESDRLAEMLISFVDCFVTTIIKKYNFYENYYLVDKGLDELRGQISEARRLIREVGSLAMTDSHRHQVEWIETSLEQTNNWLIKIERKCKWMGLRERIRYYKTPAILVAVMLFALVLLTFATR